MVTMYWMVVQLQANQTGDVKELVSSLPSIIVLPGMLVGHKKANHFKIANAPKQNPAGTVFHCYNVDEIIINFETRYIK